MSPESWATESVADCLIPVYVSGKTKIQTRDYKVSGRFPIIDQGKEPIAGWTDDESTVIHAPLPLIVFGDHTRAFKFVDRAFARGADGTQLLRPKAGIDPLFFFYACRAIDLPARGYNRHFTALKLTEISYPVDVREQRRIAAVMQLLEAALMQQTLLTDTLRQLKRVAMTALFRRGLRGESQRDTEIGPIPTSWSVVAFEAIRERLQYGTSIACSYEPTGVPVLRIPNVEPGHVNPNDIKYGEMTAVDADRYRLVDNDLLFIRTNGVLSRLGACAVYAGDPAGALFASYLIRAQLRLDRVDPYFVAYFFASEVGTSIVTGQATPAADGKFNLNTGTIDSLMLPLPPTVDEQQEIVAIIDSVDRKIALHRQKSAVIGELFGALLHKLMTGQIRAADLDISAIADGSLAEMAS